MRQGEAAVYADHASHLAVDIATKLFDRLPDEARIAGFIDGLAEAVTALPPQTRVDLGADGAPLRIKAARTLSDAETAACQEKLAGALGRPVEIAVAVVPELIAGLEIDTPHAQIRNSFRADLDRIALELTRHDHDRQ
jgi:F-type H+-transporting ATPase subunit b